jgi:hypothetical protein
MLKGASTPSLSLLEVAARMGAFELRVRAFSQDGGARPCPVESTSP